MLKAYVKFVTFAKLAAFVHFEITGYKVQYPTIVRYCKEYHSLYHDVLSLFSTAFEFIIGQFLK